MGLFGGWSDFKTEKLDECNLHTYTTKQNGVVEEFEILVDTNVYGLKIVQSPFSNNISIKLTRRTHDSFTMFKPHL